MTAGQEVFTSADTCCWHREGALILSFERPRPTITADVLDALERAVSEAESRVAPLVVVSSTKDFAFGAPLEVGFAAAANGHPEKLDAELAKYQRIMLSLRHASVPTVAAVRGVAISGACELLMHCTRVVAHDQSRIGLLEPLVGVIPGGGGLKEFAYRASVAKDVSRQIIQAFEIIAAGTIAPTASEAQRLGFLTSRDVVDAIDPLAEAIKLGLELQAIGHTSPAHNPSFDVAGIQAFQQIKSVQLAMLEGGKLTEHQFEVNMRVARVLCGDLCGDKAGGVSTEAELLALERQHFLVLAQMPLTQARLAHVRSTGKLLVN